MLYLVLTLIIYTCVSILYTVHRFNNKEFSGLFQILLLIILSGPLLFIDILLLSGTSLFRLPQVLCSIFNMTYTQFQESYFNKAEDYITYLKDKGYSNEDIREVTKQMNFLLERD